MRRWWWRGFWTVVLYLGLDIAFVVLDFEPDHARVGLLTVLSAAVAFVVWDGLGDSGPAWSVAMQRPMQPAGSDHRLAGYVRLIESHLTAEVPGPGLRERLGVLADERLARRHGMGRHDPGAADLLGSDLLRDLDGPVRRLTRADIEHHLERIERL